VTEIKIILSAYLVLMAAIGVFSCFKIKNASDYYVSGRNGSWWQISGSLFATTIGGSAILGTIELSQKAGWAAVWFLGSAALGLFILAIIAPKVSRLGHYTLPEMIGLFYGKKAEHTATLMIPVAWLGIIAVQIIAGAKVLSGLSLMTYPQGAITCGGVFIFYTLLGGQKSILKTDFVQAIIIFAGLLILFFLKLKNMREVSLPPALPTLFNDNFRFIDLLILLLTYSVTFIVGPDIYSRIFCARNEKTSRNSVILVAFLIVPVALILTFLGVTTPPDGSASPEKQFILPGTSFLNPWQLGIIAVIMLSAIMSSADTTLLSTSMILSELFTGNLDHKRSFSLTRLFILLCGVLSLWIAIRVTSILGALLLSLSFYSGAFILPVLAGIAGWKVNRSLAYTGMIAGGFTALTGKISQEVYHQTWGYWMIIAAFFVNGIFLFSRNRKLN